MIRSALLAAAATLVLALPAAAATFYTDKTAFDAATGPTSVEDFEAAFQIDAFTIGFGGGTVSCRSGKFCETEFERGISTTAALSGTQSIEYVNDYIPAGDPKFPDGRQSRVVFSFDRAITAFGIQIGGAGTVGNASIDFLTGAGDRARILSNYAGTGNDFPGNTVFGGVRDPGGFTTLTILGTGGGGDGIFLDDLQTAALAPVPLPGTLPLLLVAVGGIALLRGTRRA